MLNRFFLSDRLTIQGNKYHRKAERLVFNKAFKNVSLKSAHGQTHLASQPCDQVFTMSNNSLANFGPNSQSGGRTWTTRQVYKLSIPIEYGNITKTCMFGALPVRTFLKLAPLCKIWVKSCAVSAQVQQYLASFLPPSENSVNDFDP